MYTIEDSADWNSGYKLNAMGQGTESQRKAVERINIKLLRRQHMIHKYINNKQIQEYITIENEIEEQIQKLQHQIRDTCQLKEQYFIDNEGEHYAPYVMSNQLYNSNYNDWLKRQK